MADRAPSPTTLIIPIGTQIVTRVETVSAAGGRERPRGSVGVVVQAPTDHQHSYRVRFPDGSEAPLRRHEFAVRKQHQRGGIERSETEAAELDLYQYVIFRCVVGSRAYGLEQDESDTDRRGIYLPPAELHWSLAGAPEQLENDDSQECYWELRKFLILALKANPNVLECLSSPLVELATPLAEELLSMRSAFLSKLVYQTYNGYVMSQFKKLEQDLRSTGALKWKHAMHLIRLLLSGVRLLEEGEMRVTVSNHRERLLEIRNGQVRWEEVNAWRLELHRQFEAAYATTRLPERPAYERANAFLIQARRSVL